MSDNRTTDPIEVALHRFDLLTDRCVKLRVGSTCDICGIHRSEMHQATVYDIHSKYSITKRFSCCGALNENEYQQIQEDIARQTAKRNRAYEVMMEMCGSAAAKP